MSQTEAKKIAQKFVEVLNSKEFPFTAVYLYGSHAKNKARHWSDIDVCVVSKKFSEKNWLRHSFRLWEWAGEVDVKIEPYGMAEDAFASISPLAHEVRKTGIRIA